MTESEEKLGSLLELLKEMGLDINWLIAVTSLSAQEIAIKRKLKELGASFGEEDDFQKLTTNLIRIMEEKKIEVPHILISVIKSYRHIRAKLLHDPDTTKLRIEEAEAIFNNTLALFKTLFQTETKIKIPEFIDSITISTLNQKYEEFSNFNETVKKQVFTSILDRLSNLNWDEVDTHKVLFDFLRIALKAETSTTLQEELFEIIIRKLPTITFYSKEKILPIIAEFTKISHIKEFIRRKKLVNTLLTEYETSNSFMIAGFNAEIMLNLSSILDDREINRVMEAVLNNDQIAYSWSAKTHLRKLLQLHQNKISKEILNKVRELLEDKFFFE